MSQADKLKAALAYLGTKHVLHPQYDGKHSVIEPADTHVALTIRRVRKRMIEVTVQPDSVLQFRRKP